MKYNPLRDFSGFFSVIGVRFSMKPRSESVDRYGVSDEDSCPNALAILPSL